MDQGMVIYPPVNAQCGSISLSIGLHALPFSASCLSIAALEPTNNQVVTHQVGQDPQFEKLHTFSIAHVMKACVSLGSPLLFGFSTGLQNIPELGKLISSWSSSCWPLAVTAAFH